MELGSLVDFLSKRLKEPMPGATAHNQMQPKLPNGSVINIRQTEEPREGGVLILLYESEGGVHFPLIQRPEYDGVHSGQIALPGGKKEALDQNLVSTALRESEEEIGVDQQEVEVIGSLSEFFVIASNYNVLPVIGYANRKPEFIPEPREVSEIITPQVRSLVRSENKKVTDISVKSGFTLTSPYFHLEEKIVWGATAMMLNEFASILQEYYQG